jgi:hypothetical protein
MCEPAVSREEVSLDEFRDVMSNFSVNVMSGWHHALLNFMEHENLPKQLYRQQCDATQPL